VRTIAVVVRPLGGDSFNVALDVAKATVGEAKAEIARVQGTEVARQELYRVAVREDGKAVREDDAEPELLDDDLLALEEGAVVAMAVKELLGWRTFPDEYVELSEGGTVATQRKNHTYEHDEESRERRQLRILACYNWNRANRGATLLGGGAALRACEWHLCWH
jgi:hypothetical protein